ncbi:docking protein 1 isoform X2 [Stigmatopora argus]
MENMAAFCVESQERTMVFATEKEECVAWVDRLCQTTFQKDVGSDAKELRMEENIIYATATDVFEFQVVAQRTDAATRCGLLGSYWLQVGPTSLLLKDVHKVNIVRWWPYELLRRYGKDKLTLTIEAGRRCESGPGTFTFQTPQSEEIFHLIQSTIKQKTLSVSSGNLHGEEDKALATTRPAKSPLPEIPATPGLVSVLEHKRLRVKNPDDLAPGRDPTQSLQKPAPITLMPLPTIPTPERSSGDLGASQTESEYATPADCVQNPPKPKASASNVYVDPASILPLSPPDSKEGLNSVPGTVLQQADSIYSEVYDKVVPEPENLTEDEPIYTLPLSKADGSPGEEEEEEEAKADPFAHLYAQVQKTPPSSSPRSTPAPPSSSSLAASMAAAKIGDLSPDDVIYENLGFI